MNMSFKGRENYNKQPDSNRTRLVPHCLDPPLLRRYRFPPPTLPYSSGLQIGKKNGCFSHFTENKFKQMELGDGSHSRKGYLFIVAVPRPCVKIGFKVDRGWWI